MTNEEQKLREFIHRCGSYAARMDMEHSLSDLTALISEGYVSREEHNKVVQQRDELLKALSILLHLHYCEQEGIGAGQPTPEQWFKAVEYAEGVVQKAEAAIKNTDTK
jgi:vacuolar-type H+-ATPase subunit B/Vma2